MSFLLFNLTGLAASVLSALAMAFLFQGLSFYTAACSLFLGGVAGSIAVYSFSRYSPKKKNRPNHYSFWEWFVIAVFILASAREFLWLIYQDGNVIKVLCHNNEGDLSLHITFIHYLAKVSHWWPANPILLHAPLRYYIGMDLFNSLLLLVGVPLEQGLIWVGLLGATMTGLALWRWGKAFGMAALLFNGGLAGVLLWRGIDPETAVQWKNLFLSIFLTQRGFLYALPAGLLLLSVWRETYFVSTTQRCCPSPTLSLTQHPSDFPVSAVERNEMFGLSIQALLLGAMPLFHVYTFLFLSAILVSVMVFSHTAVVIRKGVKLLLLAWPLGLFLILLIARGGKSTVAWHLGWMQTGNPFWFWFFNFGLSLPLAALLVLLLFLRSSPEIKEARAFVWPAALIFLFCCVVRVAPWPWDNTKLMIWSWLTIAPFLWQHLIASWRWYWKGLICFFLFGSGAVTLFSWLDNNHGCELAKRSELATAAALTHYLPSDAVIAAAPQFNHPVVWLGHPVVISYPGHVWSHGLPFNEQLTALNAIMTGEEGWELKARSLGIAAIYWSSREKEAFPHSKLPFAHQQEAPLLYEILPN